MKVFGHYKIKYKKQKYYIVILENLFDTPFNPDLIFDLKGSTLNRTVTKKNWFQKGLVHKDNDFANMGLKILLGKHQTTLLLHQIKKDTE